MKDLFKKAVKPVMQKQALFQLSQIKSFVDGTLQAVLSQNFESDTDKIKYLLDTLYNIRDFVLTQTTENSLRQRLILEFQKIEDEAVMGNSQQRQEKSLLTQTEEKLEPGQKQLENEEVPVESTTDS
jgi:hypothetical protein